MPDISASRHPILCMHDNDPIYDDSSGDIGVLRKGHWLEMDLGLGTFCELNVQVNEHGRSLRGDQSAVLNHICCISDNVLISVPWCPCD